MYIYICQSGVVCGFRVKIISLRYMLHKGATLKLKSSFMRLNQNKKFVENFPMGPVVIALFLLT